MKGQFGIMAVIAVMAASGGYFVARLASPEVDPGRQVTRSAAMEKGVSAPEEMVGQRRPEFTLTDAAGRTVTADRFDGQVLLLNFWASWCAPCVEEMPMLSQFQRDYAGKGVTVLGIALDEPERAREFAGQLQLSYTVLFGLPEAMLVGRRYGNRTGMLPYSVLVGPDGLIYWTRLGVLERTQLESQLTALRSVRG